MTLDLTRRSLLKFMGGAVAGAVLSPLPWKLLDDASIWTQNWSRIARPPRGPVTWHDTTCTLCPGGCGLRARLVGASFVSAWPQPGHPSLTGACPLGLAAAQMRYHPARVRGVCRREASRADAAWQMQDAGEAVADVGRLLANLRTGREGERIALLDLRPGRALSRLYREFLQRQGGGQYLVAPDAWQASSLAFAAIAGAAALSPAPAPARAATVLAFGTPLADGAHGLGLPDRSGPGQRPRHIHIEAVAGVGAARADLWLATRPGCEAPLALALAHVLVNEALADEARVAALARTPGGMGGTFADVLTDFAPEHVAKACGLSAPVIRETAHELASRRPALVLGVGDPAAGPLGFEEESAIWCLNLLLGEPGPHAALGLRPDDDALFGPDAALSALPAPRALVDVPDGSLDLLLVDGSFPGAPLSTAQLRHKLRTPQGRIVALSPYAGGAVGLAADLLLPTPAFGEWLDDVPTPALAPHSRYAWAPAVAAPPDWAVHAAEWLARLEAASGLDVAEPRGRKAHEAELARRVACLQARGEGEVFRPGRTEAQPVSALADGPALAEALRRGGAWSAPPALTCEMRTVRLPGGGSDLAARWRRLVDGRAATAGGPLLLAVGGGLAVATGAVAAPVLNKLFRESELLAGPRRAAVNPRTAADLGLADGVTAELTTAHGSRRVVVRHDRGLPPGIVRVAAGPDPLDLADPGEPAADVPGLCGAAQEPVWRLCAASLKEVRRAHA